MKGKGYGKNQKQKHPPVLSDGRKYSNSSEPRGVMLDPVGVGRGGYAYIRQPAKADADARSKLRKAEAGAKTDASRRKWFGGGKGHSGFGNIGRSDAAMSDGRKSVSRARSEVDKVQRYRQKIGKKP